MIASIREVFTGELTSSANWGGEEHGKSWWDAVDYIGVDAYYGNGRGNAETTVEDMAKKWAPVV